MASTTKGKGILSSPAPSKSTQLTRVSAGIYKDANGKTVLSKNGKAPDSKKATDKKKTEKQTEPKPQKLAGLTDQQNDSINQRQDADLQLGDVANDQLGQIEKDFSNPYDFSQLPQAPTQVDWGSVPDAPNAPDWSQVTQGPVSGDYNKWRQEQIDSTYADFDKRNQKDFARENADFEQQMANRGIPMGSKQYNDEKTRLEQSQGDRRSSAMVQAQGIAGQNASQFADVGFQAHSASMGDQLSQFDIGQQRHNTGMSDAQTRYGAGQQAWQDAYQRGQIQRGQALQDFNSLYGSRSGMDTQNIGFSQGLAMQHDDQAFQKKQMDAQLRAAAASRGGGGGGGGSGGGGSGGNKLWQQYGFSSPMEYDAYKTAQARDQAQWEWNNNPAYKQKGSKGPSNSSVMWGNILGTAAMVGGGYLASQY